MSREKKVSLKDVASSLGVSTTLVSIVLNGKAKQYRIGEEITEKVKKAAIEMNYSPNLVARNLRGGKTQLIGLIVPDISTPFFSVLSRIIEKRAIDLNYTVVSGSSEQKPEDIKRLINVLINKGVDGLIIVPCDGSESIIRELHERKNPLVLIDRCFPNLDVSYSCLNNYKAAELATQHLIEQGYKKISLITYESEMSNFVDRNLGYEDCMKEAGLSEFIDIKRVDVFNPKLGISSILEEILKNKKIEAIVFSNSILTILSLSKLNEMNLKVPDDIALVGFDESDVFDLFYSPVTYIKQPMEQMGIGVVDILVEKIKNREQSKISRIIFNPELVVKKSSLKN